MMRSQRHTRGRLARILGGAAALGLLLGATAGRVEAANAGFVRVAGGQFTLNGAPFYFVGTNAYYLMVSAAWGASHYTDETMAMARQLGFTVLRTWAFYDGGSDGLALQPRPGVFHEPSFRALDYVLHQADLAGIRLVLPLVNGPPDFGGMAQYVAWCAPGQSLLAFYTQAPCRQLYQAYVTYVLNRVNTYNGRRYKDDPTVFAWELANEPDLPDNLDRSGQAIRAWVAEMAAFLKALDGNHLVGTGEVGGDVTTAGYSPLSAYNNQAWFFDGTKGTAFSQNTADPHVDFGSVHVYPEFWNMSATSGQTWIADHARIARGLGKPLLVGEFGASQNTAATYDAWLRTVDTEGVGGALQWQLMCEACYGMRDQFGVAYPPVSAVSDVLASAAATALARSGTSTTPAPPPPLTFTAGTTSVTPAAVTPGQPVTVAASVTADGAASGIAVALEVWHPGGARVAGQTWTAQAFTAGQTRTYTWGWSVPAGLAPGPYRVTLGVYDGSGSTTYLWSDPAATVAVQDPAAPLSFTVGPTGASPSPAARRQTVTVSASVLASAAAAGIVVDVEIYDAAGSRVLQKVYTGQAFAAGQRQTYSFGWSTRNRGTYTVKVGIFNGSWTTLYVWTNQAATFVVQ